MIETFQTAPSIAEAGRTTWTAVAREDGKPDVVTTGHSTESDAIKAIEEKTAA